MSAMLYIIENRHKWQALLKKYVRWSTIHMKLSKWQSNCKNFKGYEKAKISQ